MNLREQLHANNQTVWLDLGCGQNAAEPGFRYADILPPESVKKSIRDKYAQLDIVNCTPEELAVAGTFDFVRAQHMFEHLTWEDGLQALHNIDHLLKPNGILLLTVPDLRIHIERYLKNDYSEWSPDWLGWAEERVSADAPPSALFSVFAHSKPGEEHKWCYDAEGLLYQLNRSGHFTEIRELPVADPLAEEPFTHNRSNEDLCVIARKAT
jgi:predicted SAM-dependent methyltransferase